MRQYQALEELEKNIEYSFQKRTLLEQALTHRSAKGQHNERLEFLGDSILGFVTAAKLYDLFPQGDEGQLTRLRAKLVKEKTLAEIANELCLGDLLALGSGELKSGGFRRASILSDAFEAILGAVYLDGGLQSAEKVVHKLYENRYQSLSLTMAEKDPKTRLQEWLQSRNQELPQYEIVRSEGKDHNRTYWVSCKINQPKLETEGQGTSRRKAEQAAADKMMEQLSA
ncbi:ribonuclease III [Pleionea sediminis]|uniref:ribonuclease III n=1 Tax=Pleionea sediminis TaxID=2569479 RepID=UPI001185F647|nr:ribonuclease III [Pleionea sediminis]